MRAIFIDAENRQLSVWDYNGDWKKIGPKIGARLFEIVRAPNGDDIFIDEEGLLGVDEYTPFWSLPWLEHPLCGNALVLSSNGEGETIATATPISKYAEDIEWYTAAEVVRADYLS